MFINVLTAYNGYFFIVQLIRKILNRASSAIPEDILYKWRFIYEYMPILYEQHIKELYINCVFCSNLVRGGCHKYCLKCSAGTHLRCAPALPSIMYGSALFYGNKNEKPVLPWFYKETCSKFSRLSKSIYFKNLNFPLSTISIYNYEALEGLEKGLLSGKRPCHICASLDYEIYKACLEEEDFNLLSPCAKITSVIDSFYRDKPSY